MGLIARADLRLDPQAPAAVLDIAVEPAQQIGLERGEHRVAVALEDERLRLVEPVDYGLAGAAAEGPTHEPLDLDRPGRSDVEEAGDPRVDLVCADPQPLKLVAGEQPPIRQREGFAQRGEQAPRRALEEARDVAPTSRSGAWRLTAT